MRILAAVDLGDATPYVLDEAARHAEALGAQLHVVHVAPPQKSGATKSTATVKPDEDAEARRLSLGAQVMNIRNRGIKVEYEVIEASSPEGVTLAVKERRPDILVVGSHAHGRIYNLLMGSTLDAIIRSVACSVLVVHHPATATVTEPLRSAVAQRLRI